ncbi:MAG: hypothetical protein ACE5IK_12505 [Acidobacteriota bacterium]
MRVSPMKKRQRFRRHGTILALALGVLLAPLADAATFVDSTTAPFGTFNGVDYVIHSGRFEGATALGAFRMPYEIVAPLDPAAGAATLLLEPPHFVFAPLGRELTLGRDFLFGKGIRYATVGFGLNGFNSIDPFATDLMIAGNPVVPPTFIDLAAIVDEEILVQFVQALTEDPLAADLVGPIERRYAYGIGQSAGVLQEIHLGPFGAGLFDLTLIHAVLWRPPFAPGGVYEFLPDGSPTPVPFTPPAGVGHVMFIAPEGD